MQQSDKPMAATVTHGRAAFPTAVRPAGRGDTQVPPCRA